MTVMLEHSEGLIQDFVDVTIDVMATMAFFDVKKKDAYDVDNDCDALCVTTCYDITGVLGFSGDRTGSLVLTLSEELALAVQSHATSKLREAEDLADIPAEAACAALDATVAWAEELAAKAPLALRYAKEALNGALEEDLGETISLEARLQHICLTSEDAREGSQAFMQKRAPVWQGR